MRCKALETSLDLVANMMNPLSRKMFRDPMSSRKPAGILASSAPMMTSAQKAMAKNQPMKAQTGASVNTSNYMSAIAQLTQQGDVQTLTNILQDTRLPTNVRTAARDAIGSLQPKPSVAKPTPSYFDPTLMRRKYDMNLQSPSPATPPRITGPLAPPQVGPPAAGIETIQGPPAVSVPGYPVGTDSAVLAGLTDDQLAARMSAEANVLNAGQSKPQSAPSQVGPSMAGIPSIQGPPAVTVPGYSVGEDGAITSPLTDDQLAARMSAEMEARLKNDVGPQNIFTGTDPYDPSVYGMGDESSGLTITGEEPTAESVAFGIPALIASMRGNVRTDPTTSMIAAGQSPQGRPFGVTDTPGLDILGDFTDTGVEENGAPKAEENGAPKAEDITPAFTNDILAQLDPNSGLSQEERDIRAQSIGADLTTQGKKIIDSDLSPKQKATDFDKLFGIEGTYEERVEKRKGFLKNLLGERSKDIRTDINYNLMMTGLLIASGESPDAMTNLAKGAAAGLAGYGEAAGEEREAARREETAVALQAVSEIGEEDARVKALKAQESMGISAADVAFEREKLLAEQRAQAAGTEAQAQRNFLEGQADLNRIFDVITARIAADSKAPTPAEVAQKIMSTDSFSLNTMGMSVPDQTTLAFQQAQRLLDLSNMAAGGTDSAPLSFANEDEARAALSNMDTLPSQVIIGGVTVPVGTK
jgi:hypothetical protein